MYLQASQGDAQTWNAQFSSMMVKMLQATYLSSPMHKANQARIDVLLLAAAPRVGPPKVTLLPILAETLYSASHANRDTLLYMPTLVYRHDIPRGTMWCWLPASSGNSLTVLPPLALLPGGH